MKKRTRQILSGVLALSIVLGTPAGMAAAEAAGQQQKTAQTDAGVGGSETILEAIPESAAEDVSVDTSGLLLEEITEVDSELTLDLLNIPEKESDNDTETISDDLSSVSDSKPEIESMKSAENKSEIESMKSTGNKSEIESMKSAENNPDITITELSENKSDISSEDQFEIVSEEIPESASANGLKTKLEEVPENKTETESEETSENRTEHELKEIPENKLEVESENISDDSPKTKSEEMAESISETESGSSLEAETEGILETEIESISETELESILETETENHPEAETEISAEIESVVESTEIENKEAESTETESIETEQVETEETEKGSTIVENDIEEECTDNFEEIIYIQEVTDNTFTDTEKYEKNAPTLKELWVESVYHKAANTAPEQYLVKDFVLKGTFCGKDSRVNKIEYTTDLQSEALSIWQEAEKIRTAESKASVTGFQIALSDGTYPSIAVRAYDDAGNVSGIGQLVNDSGESIRITVDSMSATSDMALQNQTAGKPPIRKAIKLKTTVPEGIKSEVTSIEISKAEITNPETTKSEISESEITKKEIVNTEISESEITISQIIKPEISNPRFSEQERINPEISDSGDVKSEHSKADLLESEVIKPGESTTGILISNMETTDTKQKLTNPKTTDTKQELTNPKNRNVEKQVTAALEDIQQKNMISEFPEQDNSKALRFGTLLADGTKPEINISFNDGSMVNGNIYRQKRTATVHVHESDFDPDMVSIFITKDNNQSELPLANWTSDGSEHYATFELSEEGEYSIAANYVDLADQTESFIIDRIAPKMTVNLVPTQKTQSAATTNQKNATQNDSFNTGVTAVIRVTEHNFREEDFAINIPFVSEKAVWSHEGDVHTLRIPIEEDNAYQIECAYADLYGNSVKSVKKDFLIDTVAPTIALDGVGDNSANNSAIRPVISIVDSNMELSDISVSVVTGTGDLVQSAIDTECIESESGSGYRLTLTDIAEQPDNVYHLLVSACDKAGNVSESTYRFSLNRNGSVYDLTSLRKLMDQRYSTYSALGDIQIVEMNIDAVEEFDLYISRNGSLGYKAEYTKEISGSEDVGYTCVYHIKRENFAEEGTYRLIMYSRDRAGNEVNNAMDINGEEITFVIDNTAPKVVIDGVESGGVYEVEAQKVRVTVMDNFQLAEAELFLVNEANEVLKRWDYIALAGEDGALDITIPQYDGKLSLLYRVKDSTGNEIQALQGDEVAPVGFVVNVNPHAGKLPDVWGVLTAAVFVLIAVSLMAMRVKKRRV